MVKTVTLGGKMRSSVLFTIICSLVFATGCKKSGLEKIGKMPKWYMDPAKGCAAASAEHQGMLEMTKKLATSRATDDLARQLETRVEGMIKDYMAQGQAEGEGFAEMDSTLVSRTIVATTVNGVVPTKYDMIDNQFYVLVCLDTKTFADAFDKMSQLSSKQREALKARAKKEFDDLDSQLERLGE
jgi:hypothetical protein